jgi:hypothetical protein
MMKTGYYSVILINALLGFIGTLKGQTVSQVLDDGIVIKREASLFFSYPNNSFEYSLGANLSRFREYNDMSLFLPVDDIVFIYVKPINPLRHTYGKSIEFKPDPILAAAREGIEASQSLLSKVAGPPKAGGVIDSIQECDFSDLRAKYEKLTMLANKQISKSLTTIFEELKAISFTHRDQTVSEVNVLKKKMEPLRKHIDSLTTKTEEFDRLFRDFECEDANSVFLVKYVFSDGLLNTKNILAQKSGRMNNLQKAIDVVEGAMNDAMVVKDGFNESSNTWFTQIDAVQLQKSKVTHWTIIIFQHEYKMSAEGDITVFEKKELDKKSVIFRRFQRFIPEPSAGVAFTQISFPSFNTVVNENNDHVVASAGNENFRRINLSAMINYNYYLQNSDIIPFLQMGVGINSAYPTLFLGLGGRLNLPDLKKLAISFGIASTWVKTLNSLKVGDVVTGEADVEKDLTYEFSWPVKPYLGIQINF